MVHGKDLLGTPVHPPGVDSLPNWVLWLALRGDLGLGEADANN